MILGWLTGFAWAAVVVAVGFMLMFLFDLTLPHLNYSQAIKERNGAVGLLFGSMLASFSLVAGSAIRVHTSLVWAAGELIVAGLGMIVLFHLWDFIDRRHHLQKELQQNNLMVGLIAAGMFLLIGAAVAASQF